MEIESKFHVANIHLFERLRALNLIHEYALKEPATKIISDTYLDTAHGALLQGGFACRVRHDRTHEKWIGTLKGLGKAEGAVHSREELEVEIEPNALPTQWPSSPARDKAMELAGNQPLEELVTIEQTRHTRKLVRGETMIGELSLDEVTFRVGSQRSETYELEIELAGGTPDDLNALNAALLPMGVTPEPKSKFERAMKLLR
jgi:inorganic triphosphatase YgiF